ncbi:MAG: allophanate hydrolase subunit 1, partial [Proteobacteria bacterium]|nr:allophanate hydrolase subunit 1 [Pseudomonadota bacterium]
MGQNTKPERYFIGDACICWSLGTTIDREISVRILNIYRVLKTTDTMTDLGILDVVPSYNALAIHFDPCSVSVESMTDAVDAIVEEQMREDSVSEAVSESSGTSTTIPVVYDGDDLGRVADLNGLSVEEAICLHVDGSYTVAMVGFLPHFPYLIGL